MVAKYMIEQAPPREQNRAAAEEPDLMVECPASLLDGLGAATLAACGRQSHVAVEISGELFGRNRAINYRLPFHPKELDICGVLFGKREQDRLRIVDLRPLTSEYACDSQTSLSENERQAFVQLIAGSRSEAELADLQPVGWFRAHPKSYGNLTKRDLEIFDYFFNEPWQIGLVLRPGRVAPATARFFLRRADGSICRTFQEFRIPPEPGNATIRIRRDAAPDPMNRAVAMPQGLWQPVHHRTSSRISPLVWIMGAVMAFGYWWIHALNQPPFYVKSQPQAQTGKATTPRPQSVQQESEELWQKWQQEQQQSQQALETAEKLENQTLEEPPASRSIPTLPGARAQRPEDRHVQSQTAVGPPRRNERVEPVSPLPRRQRPPLATSVMAKTAPPIERIGGARPSVSPSTPAANPTSSVQASASNSSVTGSKPAPPPSSVIATQIPTPSPTPRITEQPLPSATQQSPPPSPQPPPASLPVQTRPVSSPGPTSGRLIWTGRLEKDGFVIIDVNGASTGSYTGELPGQPVKIAVYPGNLTSNGFVLYTNNQKTVSDPWESAGPQNGWNRTTYTLDPRRAASVTVAEAPGPQNGWKRLVLRTKGRGPSVIFIDWKLR